MKHLSILFDLDGTLTDSGEGIINCAQLALRHLGIDADDRQALRRFVGPPLRESFPKFGVPGDRVAEAISVFRRHYLAVGKFQNFPYPGIEALLRQLKADGFRLYVATSKVESTAVEILTKFGLAGYFDKICGAETDGRDTKDAVIAYLLKQLDPEGRVLMVGDTVFDVEGAGVHGIPTIGVSWGYGDVREMENAGAAAIVSTPEALYRLILEQ